MASEWHWAAAVVSAPFILFGVFELIARRRRRRERKIAQRPKHRLERPGSRGAR